MSGADFYRIYELIKGDHTPKETRHASAFVDIVSLQSDDDKIGKDDYNYSTIHLPGPDPCTSKPPVLIPPFIFLSLLLFSLFIAHGRTAFG